MRVDSIAASSFLHHSFLLDGEGSDSITLGASLCSCTDSHPPPPGGVAQFRRRKWTRVTKPFPASSPALFPPHQVLQGSPAVPCASPLCPVNSGYLILPRLSALFLDSGSLPGSAWVALPCTAAWKLSPGIKLEQS